MFLKSKFLGVALATCVAVGVSACGGGGMPKCDSSEVKKAFEEHRNIKDLKQMGAEFSNFKTLSEDKEFKGVVNCQCAMKMSGQNAPMKFSAERLQDGGIAISIDDVGL